MSSIIEKLSYGVYIVTSVIDGKPNGCTANCAVQITAEPPMFAVSINHDNYTNKCITESGKFAISVLAVDSKPIIIGTFGFRSGRNFDKFASVEYMMRDGLPIIKDSCGYLTCEVTGTTETPTHTVFIGKLISSEVFGDRKPMTYDYYHKTIKGKSPSTAPTYVKPETNK